jgi:hypothetical protein
MKVIDLALCLVALGLYGGCALVDGTNTYHLKGRLVSVHDRQPVAGARIVGAVFLDYDSPEEVWKSEASITDSSGVFDAPARQLWGGMYPIFLIPDSRTPPPLDNVAIYIGVNGKWQKHIVPVPKSQQYKVTDTDRWIELGELPYDPGAATVTTHPAGD